MEINSSFILHQDILSDNLYMLSMEERGKYITAIHEYVKDGTVPTNFDTGTMMLFNVTRRQIDRDKEKYAETCKKRSEAGKKGGRPTKANASDEKAKKANGFSEKQTKAKKADNVNVSDSDSVSDNDSVSVSDNDSVNDNVAVILPTKDGGNYELAETDINELQQQYKNIDVSLSLKHIASYLEQHPDKRRTGYDNYIKLWLQTDDDKAIKAETDRKRSTGMSGEPSYSLEEYEKYSMFDD